MKKTLGLRSVRRDLGGGKSVKRGFKSQPIAEDELRRSATARRNAATDTATEQSAVDANRPLTCGVPSRGDRTLRAIVV